jgi:alpha/beta superfamily hydrolase
MSAVALFAAARTVPSSAVYAGASALVALHLFVAAALEGGALATVLPLAVTVGLAAAFPRLRPGVGAWVAFVVGALTVADGVLHVVHGATGADDATGIASGAAGAMMLALAARIATRPKARRRAVVRWGARAGAVTGAAATVLLVVMPLAVAVYFVHKQPRALPAAAFGIPHRDVMLRTSDGIDLAGWYVPSRNGAAVVLVHGAGGDRAGGIESRAAMLARHGYGVLLYDARGGGESGGRMESMGWTWHRDAAAAVDFLAARGVTRIGALGLSTGAETVLEAAGRDPRIDAVVAEGAQTRSLAEMRLLPHTAENLFYALDFGTVAAVYRVLSLHHEPPSLARMAERTQAPLLLISSGTGFERDAARVYARHAGTRATLWELPNVAHTGGLKAFPTLYDERVTAFLDRALLR